MASGLAKIHKPAGVKVTELEQQIAKAIFDLEVSASDLTADLRPLQFTAAKEVSISLCLINLIKKEEFVFSSLAVSYFVG